MGGLRLPSGALLALLRVLGLPARLALADIAHGERVAVAHEQHRDDCERGKVASREGLAKSTEWREGGRVVLYFSATGNSRHVAEAIATRVGDRAVSIESYKDEKHPCIAVDDGGYLGFICPTYCCGMPAPAVDFLARASFDVPASAYVFTATTFGTTSGQTTRFAADLLHEKGVDVEAQFGVQMPDTWTPMFDLSDGARIAAVNARADEWIDKCADMVAGRVKGSHGLRAVPTFAARLYHRLGLPTCEDTSKFTVDAEACVGCGLCARRCPTDAIKMRGGMPAWVKPSCAACLRCLHSCPKFAIQRGHKTRAHGQYRHP